MTRSEEEPTGGSARSSQWRPGLLIAALAVSAAAFPALIGAESLREYRVYSSPDALGMAGELNAEEAFFGVSLAVTAVIVVWIAGITAAVLVAVLRHISLWRTLTPVALAVPFVGALLICGGAVAALQSFSV